MAEFSLVQLRHFCAVAELGSIAEAARQRHVSATAVGAAISTLESVLGTELCHRERARGVTLTPGGHHFYEEAKRLIRSADSLLRSHPVDPDPYLGPLRVGAFRPISPAILPGLLEELDRTHPELQVEFTTGTAVELLDKLLDGDLHCFVSYDAFSTSGMMPQGVVIEVLYDAQIHVLLSSSHPLATRESVSFDDLRQEPMVLFESNPSRPFSAPVLGQVFPGALVRYRTSELEVMRAIVARGLGYAFIMSPMSANTSFEGRDLSKVALDMPVVGSPVVLVRPAGGWQHPALRILADTVHRLVERGELGASL